MIQLLAETTPKSSINTMQHHEKHTLHWHSYSDHLREALKDMILFSDFADVTLVTDDKKQIRAHRNILSACSPVLKNILLSDCTNINPVIFLRGIKHSEMESIMQFMYLGEARIYHDRMSEFLQVSKDLEIKELATHDQTSSNAESNGYKTNDVDDNEREYFEEDNETITITDEDGTQTEAKPILRNNAANKKVSKAEGSRYACNQCDQQFTTQASLTTHIQSIHEGVKYPCNKCDYKATQHSNLKQHIQSKHEGVKYACNQCDYQATRQDSLAKHIQYKHEGVKYDCNQCDYQARRPDILENHIQTIHEGFRYECNQCDQKFTHQRSLTKHIQSKHEGIKYACNQCDHQATQKSGLALHIQSIHEGVRYACEHCDYQATRQDSLMTHIQARHKGVKYDCDQCDYQTGYPSGLTTHIKKNHL